MGLFSSLIKPSIAINMLRKNLSNQLGKEVKFFSLIYTAQTSTLDFIVDGIRYKFEDAGIRTLIDKTAKSQLQKNQTLDLLVANVDDKNNCDAKLYFTETINKIPEKKFVTFKF